MPCVRKFASTAILPILTSSPCTTKRPRPTAAPSRIASTWKACASSASSSISSGTLCSSMKTRRRIACAWRICSAVSIGTTRTLAAESIAVSYHGHIRWRRQIGIYARDHFMAEQQSKIATDEEVATAAQLILRAKYPIALTGAGMSVESGIPPFRGPGGLWTKYGEPPMNGFQIFMQNPKKAWEERESRRNDELFKPLQVAKPNRG